MDNTGHLCEGVREEKTKNCNFDFHKFMRSTNVYHRFDPHSKIC